MPLDTRTRFTCALAFITLVAPSGSVEAARQLVEDCASSFGQCGGITCTNGSPTCSDSAYVCCPTNFACLRQSQWYWQCLPSKAGSASAPRNAPIETFPPRVYSPYSPSNSTTSPPPTSPLSPSPEETSPSPQEYSPESSPEDASAPEGSRVGVCDYTLSGVYQFVSYLDKSGRYAPDGNYKETCKSITYNCETDLLIASCANVDLGSTNITTLAGTHFNATSLSDAAFCDGNIGNSYGVLVCDEPSDMPGLSSPGPEVPCEALYSDNYYESKLDASGGNAPDGNYKQTCKQITYACASDTIHAKCGNGKSGSAHRYLDAAMQHATECFGAGNIDNVFGTLACVATPEEYPPSEEDLPSPEEYSPTEGYSPSPEEYSASPEDYSPESSPEVAAAPKASWVEFCDNAASDAYLYVSYLDESGTYVPKGAYRETCKEISYACDTDTLYAKCIHELSDSEDMYKYLETALLDASKCFGFGMIANELGTLVCDTFYDAYDY